MARTERSSPSEPSFGISKDTAEVSTTDERPSVRQQLREIKEERKERSEQKSQPKRTRTRQTEHKQPKRTKSTKEKER